ncbi:MAG TPA: glycosyltransferase family 39 protein, partial [Kofleriaceae bacterium]|nr:glycosyltransferase family 39 protein [Kofleriaceae bacterium]
MPSELANAELPASSQVAGPASPPSPAAAASTSPGAPAGPPAATDGSLKAPAIIESAGAAPPAPPATRAPAPHAPSLEPAAPPGDRAPPALPLAPRSELIPPAPHNAVATRWPPDQTGAVPASARRPLGFELAVVVVLSLVVLVPGIWSYSLVDPWETHYGEVGRMMLQNHDWVHTEWPQDGEGFRSKPVLSFWLMAGGMRAVGLAADGGYSGEMVHDGRTMIAIRLPFILCAVCGLALMWWMLARLVNRRLAWLALLVVGSCPFFCLVARQGIPDMPLVACVMGALALFIM